MTVQAGRLRRGAVVALSGMLLAGSLSGCGGVAAAAGSALGPDRGPLQLTVPDSDVFSYCVPLSSDLPTCTVGATITNTSRVPQSVQGFAYLVTDRGTFVAAGAVSRTVNPGLVVSTEAVFELPDGARASEFFIGSSPSRSQAQASTAVSGVVRDTTEPVRAPAVEPDPVTVEPDPVVATPEPVLPTLDVDDRGDGDLDYVLLRDVEEQQGRLVLTFDRLSTDPAAAAGARCRTKQLAGGPCLKNVTVKVREVGTAAGFSATGSDSSVRSLQSALQQAVTPTGAAPSRWQVVTLAYDDDGLATWSALAEPA